MGHIHMERRLIILIRPTTWQSWSGFWFLGRLAARSLIRGLAGGGTRGRLTTLTSSLLLSRAGRVTSVECGVWESAALIAVAVCYMWPRLSYLGWDDLYTT
jgi:hypothetical protein